MAWISESQLVSAMSNAGIFGVLASGAMDGDLLKAEIRATKEKTKNNFGVNIILMNPKLHDLIDVCGEEKVSHIILAGGIPDKIIIDKIHTIGIQVITFAPALSIAKRLFKHGIDALILEGSEAGGHVGSLSTLILIQDILLNVAEYPIFVAGGILRGEVVASIAIRRNRMSIGDCFRLLQRISGTREFQKSSSEGKRQKCCYACTIR